MVGGVTNQMDERLRKRVENAFVQIGGLSGEIDGDVFAALRGQRDAAMRSAKYFARCIATTVFPVPAPPRTSAGPL